MFNRYIAALLILAGAVAGCNEHRAQQSAADTAPPSVSGVQAHRITAYRVGAARVIALFDGREPWGSPDMFHGISPAQAKELLRAGGELAKAPDGGPAWSSPLWAFLVETGGKRILVDTGVGDAMPGMGGVAQALQQAGVTPAEVDAIAITHMHGDHTGGLLDANGKPRFPNAILYLNKAEVSYWTDPDRAARAQPGERADFEAAPQIIKAYGRRVKLFAGNIQIAPGFTAEPLPGHTPGHTGYRLRSGGQEMVFVGDLLHSLAIQMPYPEVSTDFDVDADAARAMRLAFLRAEPGKGKHFAGAHFSSPVVRIENAAKGYKAVAATPAR